VIRERQERLLDRALKDGTAGGRSCLDLLHQARDDLVPGENGRLVETIEYLLAKIVRRDDAIAVEVLHDLLDAGVDPCDHDGPAIGVTEIVLRGHHLLATLFLQARLDEVDESLPDEAV
jgi:hypothetical protein